MNIFFRKLSLTVKLLLVGIVPIILLIYFSIIIYNEKKQKLNLMGDYIEHVKKSAILADLINNLAIERRYSYHYLLKKDSVDKMNGQRIITDSIIKKIQNIGDSSLKYFTKYTFLDGLPQIRMQVDRYDAMDPNTVIDFYTRAIFRLNTLNSWLPPSNVYLASDYQDLVSQHILREMLTLLEILRTNIYNVLYTRQYMVETLIGSYGVYKTYQSYDTEFNLKSSQTSKNTYDSVKNSAQFKPMMDYINKIFGNFKFDSTYNADQWWTVSTQGISVLMKQQTGLRKSVDSHLTILYNDEKRSQNLTFTFLALVIIFVIGLIFFVINNISGLLQELKIAAGKISKGATGLMLKHMPGGVIGSLAKSILVIEKNNLVLAKAAREIGKGNFKVAVKSRSEDDILAISIQKMKRDLIEFNLQKDKIQQETLALVYQRDEFFSMTSHELKTPVTSLKAYTQLLLMDVNEVNMENRKSMLIKMDQQINKLITLINDLLDTSRLQYDQLDYKKENIKLNKLVSNMISEIQLSNPMHKIILQKNINASVYADFNRLGQVISNILTNAIKYAPNNKEIIVRLDKMESSVICSFKDFGYGIKKSEQDKIFERFYRISGENLHTFPGLGLGLFISKQIIEKHEGKLWVESEFGKGSTFYFELPLTTE